MPIDFPEVLREPFNVRNDTRAREVTEAFEQLARINLPGEGLTGAPGTVPLLPLAKDLNLVTVTATPYSAGVEDVILVDDDTVGGDVVINLLAVAATYKYPRWIKKLGSTGNVIITPDGAETIDGAATATLVLPKTTLAIISDGSNWQII